MTQIFTDTKPTECLYLCSSVKSVDNKTSQSKTLTPNPTALNSNSIFQTSLSVLLLRFLMIRAAARFCLALMITVPLPGLPMPLATS
jgi:hypothetical protein